MEEEELWRGGGWKRRSCRGVEGVEEEKLWRGGGQMKSIGGELVGPASSIFRLINTKVQQRKFRKSSSPPSFQSPLSLSPLLSEIFPRQSGKKAAGSRGVGLA